MTGVSESCYTLVQYSPGKKRNQIHPLVAKAIHRMAANSRIRIRILACSLALLAAPVASIRGADDPNGVAFFETKIRPVLIEKCHQCHSSEAKKPKGGLKVDSRAAIRRGRDFGASRRAWRPGCQLALSSDLGGRPCRADAAEGDAPRLCRRRLPPVDFDGSTRPREGTRPEAAIPASSAKSRDWWSLKPVQNPSVPRVDTLESAWNQNSIDAFILAKLQERRLSPRPRPTAAR